MHCVQVSIGVWGAGVAQLFCRMPTNLNSPDYFLMIKLRLNIYSRDTLIGDVRPENPLTSGAHDSTFHNDDVTFDGVYQLSPLYT